MEAEYVDMDYSHWMDNSSECLDMNAELWLFRQDYTTAPATMALFALFYLAVIVAGVTGNICVLLAISRTKSLQTVPNMFIFSLSCSDLVVCCTSATITPITAFKKEWLFGPLLCSIAPFIAGISLCFSTFTLTAISIDRYRLIRYPMKKAMSKTHALAVIAAICMLSSALSAPTLMKQKLGPFENFCGMYCTEDWQGDVHGRRVYGAVMLVVQFVIPLSIILISYTAISLRIGQSMIIKGAHRKSCLDTSSEWQATLTDQQRAALKRRQRTNRMLIGMVVAFSASWAWSVAFNVCRDYDMLPEYVVNQEYLLGITTHCMAMTSTVWNPLLYAMLNLQFRAAFLRLMPDRLKQLAGVDLDEKANSPLVNGALSEFPASVRNGSSKKRRAPATTCGGEGTAAAATKYGATAQNDVAGAGTGAVSTALTSVESKPRKPSAIRVIVSRLSASVADSTASPLGDEQRLPLLEDSPSSSRDVLQVSGGRRRRSTACIVRMLRSPSPSPASFYDSYVTMSRTNSF